MKLCIGITGPEFDCGLVRDAIDVAKRRDDIEVLNIYGRIADNEPIRSRVLVRIISGKEIELSTDGLTNEAMASLLSAVRLHYDIKDMRMSGEAACRAVTTTLLQDPNCNVVRLQMDPMNDECAIVFGNALKHNRKLKGLRFGVHGYIIGKRGIAAFATALCDPTSINTIHASNHTLTTLGGGRMIPTIKLNSFLAFNNRYIDKKEVFIHKVLHCTGVLTCLHSLNGS